MLNVREKQTLREKHQGTTLNTIENITMNIIQLQDIFFFMNPQKMQSISTFSVDATTITRTQTALFSMYRYSHDTKRFVQQDKVFKMLKLGCIIFGC